MAPTLHPRVRNLLVASALVVGVGAGSAAVASAATGSGPTTTSTPTTHPPTGPMSSDPANPADLNHGPGETLLTGAAEQSAVDAAKAAEPGATVIRAESDSAGAAYEVHMTKSDGSVVTVKLDSNFKVSETDAGFGPGPAGLKPPMPDHSAPDSATTTN